MKLFSDHVTVTPLNTRKYALDSRDGTLTVTRALIIGGCFTGHLAFAIAFGEISAIEVKFYFYLNVAKKVTR